MPTGTEANWGDVGMPSPRLSFEEYVNLQVEEEDKEEPGENEKIELKPILVIARSPRHSLDSTDGEPILNQLVGK